MKDPQVIPTGVPVLDRLLHGGQLAQGVHCLLGPTGGGKTTLAAMIAAEGALRAAHAGVPGERLRPWVFVTLDMPRDQIEVLARSHAAKIDRNLLATARSPSCFSQPGDPREYERRRRKELVIGGRPLLTEVERYAAIVPTLSRHLLIIDLEKQEFGTRGCPAGNIKRAIDCLLPDNACPAGVIIDYAGVAVDKYVESHKFSRKVVASMLQVFATDCRALFAKNFGCPVWIVHQLTGAANSRSAGANFNHQDALECPKFSTGFDVCMVMGTHMPSSGQFSIHCTKAPQEPAQPNPAVVYFDEDFATIHEHQHLRCDPIRRQIRSTDRHTLHISATAMAELDRLANGDR